MEKIWGENMRENGAPIVRNYDSFDFLKDEPEENAKDIFPWQEPTVTKNADGPQYPVLRQLRKTRLRYHLTQKVLADYLGVTIQYYSQIERGINTLSYANALQLATFFHTTTEELFLEDYINGGVLVEGIAEEMRKQIKRKECEETEVEKA